MRTVRSNPNSNSTKLRGQNASPLVKNRCLVCNVQLSSNHSIHCRKHYKSGRAKIRDEDVDDRVKMEVPHDCPQCGKQVDREELLNSACPWCGWESARAKKKNALRVGAKVEVRS